MIRFAACRAACLGVALTIAAGWAGLGVAADPAPRACALACRADRTTCIVQAATASASSKAACQAGGGARRRCRREARAALARAKTACRQLRTATCLPCCRAGETACSGLPSTTTLVVTSTTTPSTTLDDGTTSSSTTTSSTTSTTLPPVCGDATCNGDETCADCASDCGACPGCGGAGDATTALDAEETTLLGLVNAYRVAEGAEPFAACTALSRAAQGHSEDMRDQNYFSHVGLNGSAPWDRACTACYELGCGPQTAMAESIAAGNVGAAATLAQWKASPGDNANVLSTSFVRVGIGRASGGGTYGTYWTLLFAGASEASCN